MSMITLEKWRNIERQMLTFPSILVLVTLMYVVIYFVLPVTPGGLLAHESSDWWTWFDQGQYLKAAKALYQFDFSPEQYFYPPLYSALGTLFLAWFSNHPFFFVNLICLLWFVYVFIRLSDCYFPRVVSVLLIFASILAPIRIFENFLIPWTTTLSTALLATGILGLIWVQEIKDGQRSKLEYWQMLFVAVCLGLMVPTRPLDSLIGIWIGSAYVLTYWRLPSSRSNQGTGWPGNGRIGFGRFFMITLAGALVGPAIFIGFNSFVYGAPLGSYWQVATSHSFYVADIPEKFYSIWLNAQPLYGEVNAALVQCYPWLLIALAGTVWIILRGDFLLRTIALAIMLFLMLYLPYGDLLPTGIWRYLNIHYFKWTFPFFALFACLLLRQVLCDLNNRLDKKLALALLILVPALLLCIQMQITSASLSLESKQNKGFSAKLPKQPVDFIDIKGLTGTFPQIYFGGHALAVDGSPLGLYRDFRVLDHGPDLRILFIRPIEGNTLEFVPEANLRVFAEQINALWGSYHFALGVPHLLNHQDTQRVFAAYQLNQSLDFSNQGISQFYVAQGFSIPESQGRWTISDSAMIEMRIKSILPGQQAQLALTMKALLAGSKQCQQVVIIANQHSIGTQRLCQENQGQNMQTYRYTIPAGTMTKDGLLQIQIVTPDAISPRQLNINNDERQLGVFLQSLVVSQ